MTHPCPMPEPRYTVSNIITLLGGGPVDEDVLQMALHRAPYLVAADGGANYAHAHKIPVKHIVGDFDSVINLEFWQDNGVNLVHLDEQDTTDFDKCLTTIAAPLYLCVGFLGQRLDHSLACLRSLVAHTGRQAILIGENDITLRCPKDLEIEMETGDRVSLFPMGPVEGVRSEGLRWSIAGLEFSPSGQIGTSNEALGGPMRLSLSNDQMLLILPISYLDKIIESLDVPTGAPAR